MKNNKKQSRLRDQAARRQSGCCYYCELPMCIGSEDEFAQTHGLRRSSIAGLKCTAEHLVAKCEGGSTDASNIVAAHRCCNAIRHRCKNPLDPMRYKARVRGRTRAGRWPTAVLLQQVVSMKTRHYGLPRPR